MSTNRTADCDGRQAEQERQVKRWRLDNRLLLKAPQAAYALEISLRKLWALTASGEIPYVRIGRSVRYPVESLREWIDAQKQGGAGQ